MQIFVKTLTGKTITLVSAPLLAAGPPPPTHPLAGGRSVDTPIAATEPKRNT